jgi:tetratricopeptide (TPR) repeat protein
MTLAPLLLCLAVHGGPHTPAPSTLVQELLSARWLSPEQRSEVARFHGAWTQADVQNDHTRAHAAHLEWRLDDPSLRSEDADGLHRAHTHVRLGELTQAVSLLRDLPDSIERNTLLAQALLKQQRRTQAIGLLAKAAEAPVVTANDARMSLMAGRLLDGLLVDGHTDPNRTSMHLAALEAARVDLDPAFWPLLLDEARLLRARDNRTEAANALQEVILLNPRAAEAWYELGLLHLGVFDFDGVEGAVGALNDIAPKHVLAQLLRAEAMLVQHQLDPAQDVLGELQRRGLYLPQSRALRVALASLKGNTSQARSLATEAARNWPGDHRIAWTTGRLLSLHRRYTRAEYWLVRAIDIAPHEFEVWTELGLMRWQAGHDKAAKAALEQAVALDPFNRAAANSLHLLGEMERWSQIRRGNVIVRWKPGRDDVFARLVADEVEAIHAKVESNLHWTPSQLTVVELHPDHEHFGVRVTGLPDVHTSAACTGPVVAMEVPREGPPGLHAGPYDWHSALLHELSHVAHLDMTASRVPIWLSEGAAVADEPVPLPWPSRVLLAARWRAGTLLDVDALSMAFVRPQRQDDRQLAYAQSAWFILYLRKVHGDDVVAGLLRSLGRDQSLDQAFIEQTGRTQGALWADFLDQQVPLDLASWGVATVPSDHAVKADLTTLSSMVKAAPRDPALLELLLRRRLADALPEPADMEALQRLALARPGAPWPRLQLAAAHEANGDWPAAAAVLDNLAQRDRGNGQLLDRLAMAHRAAGQTEASLEAMRLAVRCAPYDVSRRERAAALAIEAGRRDLARSHVEAMILLEPDEALHRARLQSLSQPN